MGNKNKFFCRSFLILLSVFLGGVLSTSRVFAGGAFWTTKDGKPVLWKNNVTFRMAPNTSVDKGTAPAGGAGGCSLDIAKAQAFDLAEGELHDMVVNAFKVWTDAIGGGLTVTEGAPLPEPVTYDNAEKYLSGAFTTAETPPVSVVSTVFKNCYDADDSTPCYNPVVLDLHGEIIDAMFGECKRFNIFAATVLLPDVNSSGVPNSNELKSAQIVVNGTCFEKPDSPDVPASVHLSTCTSGCQKTAGLSKNELIFTLTHELGHFIGFDHALVNTVPNEKCSATTPEAGCDPDKMPIMRALSYPGVESVFTKLHYDDVMNAKRLYGDAAAKAKTCLITGNVYSSFDRKAVAPYVKLEPTNQERCWEVVAKRGGDEKLAVGFVSGAESPRPNDYGPAVTDCVAGSCGSYQLLVDPGTYNMGVHSWKGLPSADNWNIEPCHDPVNGAPLGSTNLPTTEDNNDPAMENPYNPPQTQVTAVCPAAGGVVPNINLWTN